MSVGLDLLASVSEHGSIVTFRLLEPDMFVDQNEVNAYNMMRTHLRRHSVLPSVDTIMEETGVDFVDTPEPVDYYLGRLFTRNAYNNVRPLMSDMRDHMVSQDIPAMRETVHQMSSALRQSDVANDLQHLGEVAEGVLAHYDDTRLAYGLSGITSGWSLMDEQTGGYQNGDLIVYVARPGMGKTYLLLFQAWVAWMSGYNVMFISMEMPLRQIGVRIFGIHAGINPTYIRKSQLSHYAELRFRQSLDELNNSNRFNLMAGNMGKTTSEIDMTIQQVNPDIIFIDGMYLMKTSSAARNAGRYEKIAHVVDDLKEMTIRRDRPILATTQFGRQAGKGGASGSLENIGYSDTIGTHSSIVCGIGKLSAADSIKYGRDAHSTRVVNTLKGREGEETRLLVDYTFSPISFRQAQYLEPEVTEDEETHEEQRTENMNWMRG